MTAFPIMCLLNRCEASRLAACTYGIINAREMLQNRFVLRSEHVLYKLNMVFPMKRLHCKFSLAKRKCGIGLIVTRLKETTCHCLAMSVLLLNLRKIGKVLFVFFLLCFQKLLEIYIISENGNYSAVII